MLTSDEARLIRTTIRSLMKAPRMRARLLATRALHAEGAIPMVDLRVTTERVLRATLLMQSSAAHGLLSATTTLAFSHVDHLSLHTR